MVVSAATCLLLSAAQAGFPAFECHRIARTGNRMGQTSLVDVDKDGDLDWIAGCSGGDLWWFEYKGPDEWVMHTVGHKAATDVGGTAFDVNGDGDNDVVRTDTWFENADGKGKRWVAHKNIDFGQADARWPLMTKSWVVDLDGDGDNDVVQAEGDCLSGRVAWHENSDGKGLHWNRHIIEDKSGQDFHSLAVADFDRDGDLDVFSGGGPLTKGTNKWFIWENSDGKALRWQRHLILSGKRCHEAKAGDVDGDGDVDICSKPWNGDEHVYLRNMLVEGR